MAQAVCGVHQARAAQVPSGRASFLPLCRTLATPYHCMLSSKAPRPSRALAMRTRVHTNHWNNPPPAPHLHSCWSTPTSRRCSPRT